VMQAVDHVPDIIVQCIGSLEISSKLFVMVKPKALRLSAVTSSGICGKSAIIQV